MKKRLFLIKDEGSARALARLGERLKARPASLTDFGSQINDEFRWAKVTTQLTARSGDTLGKGKATPFDWDETGNAVTQKNSDGTDLIVDVYNTSESAVEVNERIQITKERNLYVALEGSAPSAVTPRIRFELLTRAVGFYTARAITIIGSPTDPTNGGVAIARGDTFNLYDSDNSFSGAVVLSDIPLGEQANWSASKGWAYLNTVANSGDVFDRWEMESCSQTVNEIEATLPTDACLFHRGYTETAPKMYFDMPYSPSSPDRVYPLWAETSDDPAYNFMIQSAHVKNTENFDAVAGSKVRLRLHIESGTIGDLQTPDGVGSSAPHATTETYWEVVGVEKQIARWRKVKKLSSSPWELAGSGAGQYREGYVDDTSCEPTVESAWEPCDPNRISNEAWAFYIPETHSYQPVSTEAAMMREPEVVEVPTGLENGLADCSVRMPKKNRELFSECPTTPTPDEVVIASEDLDVVVALDGVTNAGQICGTRRTIKVCSNTPATTSCVDVCEVIKASPSATYEDVVYNLVDGGGGVILGKRKQVLTCDSTLSDDVSVDLCAALPKGSVSVLTDIYQSGSSICSSVKNIEIPCYIDSSAGAGPCISICDLICDCDVYAGTEACGDPPAPDCDGCSNCADPTHLPWLQVVTQLDNTQIRQWQNTETGPLDSGCCGTFAAEMVTPSDREAGTVTVCNTGAGTFSVTWAGFSVLPPTNPVNYSGGTDCTGSISVPDGGWAAGESGSVNVGSQACT